MENAWAFTVCDQTVNLKTDFKTSVLQCTEMKLVLLF